MHDDRDRWVVDPLGKATAEHAGTQGDEAVEVSCGSGCGSLSSGRSVSAETSGGASPDLSARAKRAASMAASTTAPSSGERRALSTTVPSSSVKLRR
ncbi:MAG: hypothetical protein ACLQNG_18790 [Acidimicrobiales bacterium]